LFGLLIWISVTLDQATCEQPADHESSNQEDDKPEPDGGVPVQRPQGAGRENAENQERDNEGPGD
jgi:hypothetical protein